MRKASMTRTVITPKKEILQLTEEKLFQNIQFAKSINFNQRNFKMKYFKITIKIALFMLLVLNADSSKACDTIDTNIRDSVTCNIIRSEKSIDVIRVEGHGTIKDYEKLTTKASAEKIEEVRVMAARQFLKDKGEDKLRKIISEYGLLSAYFIFYISHTGEIVAISIGFPNENANDREKFPDMMLEEIFGKIADCIRFPSWDSKPLYTSFATGITYKQ